MRDFSHTAEPTGAHARTRSGHIFVIQEHAATHLHYDFRLELDGVLLSWAVPKGPSLSPAVRRLATRVEDHPLDYASFEGVIPEGQYGAGTVLVWDRGTWQPEGDPHAALAKGRLTFTLNGQKLHGGWQLVRTRSVRGAEDWLLSKARDAAANDQIDITATRPESVLSGRTLNEIATGPHRVFRGEPGVEPTGAPTRTRSPTARRSGSRTAEPAVAPKRVRVAAARRPASRTTRRSRPQR